MDEEDGRPGALAAKNGHPDAPLDALPTSLRSSSEAVILSDERSEEPKDLHFARSHSANFHVASRRRVPQASLLTPGILRTFPSSAIFRKRRSTKEKPYENVPGK
jgi:hypothetical protein